MKAFVEKNKHHKHNLAKTKALAKKFNVIHLAEKVHEGFFFKKN